MKIIIDPAMTMSARAATAAALLQTTAVAEEKKNISSAMCQQHRPVLSISICAHRRGCEENRQISLCGVSHLRYNFYGNAYKSIC